MNHAGHYSTSQPRVSLGICTRSGKRASAALAVALAAGLATLAVVPSPTASADALSSAQAQAAALGAKLNAEQAQISVLNGQYEAASYHLSQVNAQITATKAQLAADQAVVNKDQAQLRTQAVADYMTSGTSSQAVKNARYAGMPRLTSCSSQRDAELFAAWFADQTLENSQDLGGLAGARSSANLVAESRRNSMGPRFNGVNVGHRAQKSFVTKTKKGSVNKS